MTPEEIRAEAIERLARSLLEHADANVPESMRSRGWDQTTERVRDEYRDIVTPFVDWLGDLLPTRIERRELEHGWVVQNISATGEVTAVGKPCIRQRRYVTAWKEMTA